MRIDLNSGIRATEASLEKSSSARSASASPESAAEPEFSSKQAHVSSLTATSLAAPEIRHEKVQALRAQVQSGSYRVSPDQISASLFDHIRVT